MKNSKVSRGKGFHGAAEYDLSHDGGRVVGGNLSGRTAREIAAEFGASQKLRPDIEKPVWHQSLRLVKGEQLDEETWSRLADRHLHNLGFTDLHQRVYFVHDHPDGQHVHILASRIALDGTIFLGQNENIRSTASVVLLEIEFGLHVSKTAESNPATGLPSTRTWKKKPKRAEIEKAVRTGFKPPRLAIQDAMDQVLTFAKDFDQLCAELRMRGVLLDLKTGDTGQIVGVVFESGGLKIGGSKLGDSYKAFEIFKKLTENSKHVGIKIEKSARPTDSPRTVETDRNVGVQPKQDPEDDKSDLPETDSPWGGGEEVNRLKIRFR